MRDRDIVDVLVDGDPAGPATAYDTYAASLHAYGRAMLAEPTDAADAVQDTFVIAAARLAALRDPGLLRPWLYAVARNECHRRIRSRAGQADADEIGDLTGEGAGDPEWSERGELRGLLLAAINGLSPDDREIIELTLRHELDAADLADVLDVSTEQAHRLASRARAQLERSVEVLLVARTGRQNCADLDELLAGWDGQLTDLLRRQVGWHIQDCPVCGARKRREISPAMLLSVLPLMAEPTGLRGQVLSLVSDASPDAARYRQLVAARAEPFGPYGFPVQIVPAATPAPRPRPDEAATQQFRPDEPPTDTGDLVQPVPAPPDDWGTQPGRGRHEATAGAAAAGMAATAEPAAAETSAPGQPGSSSPDGPGGGVLRDTRTRLIALGTVAAVLILLGGGGTAYFLLGHGKHASGAAHQAAPARGVITTMPSAAPTSGSGSARPRPSASASASVSVTPSPSASASSSDPVRPPGTSTPTGRPSISTPTQSAPVSAPPAKAPPTSAPTPATLRETPGTVTLVKSAGASYTGTFTLTATGGTVLFTVAVPSGESYLSVSPSSATLAAGQSATITVTLTPPATGAAPPFDSTLTVDPDGLAVTVQYPPSG